MFWVGVFTAAMTAFYVFRAFFLCFFGEYRGHHHPHESPPIMWIPLAVLAALSLGGGFINIPQWLAPMFPLDEGTEVGWLENRVAIAAGLGADRGRLAVLRVGSFDSRSARERLPRDSIR